MHTVRSLRLKRDFYVVILLIRINFWVYIWGLHETNNLIHMIEWNTYGHPLKFWIYLKLIFEGNLKKKNQITPWVLWIKVSIFHTWQVR